LKWVYRFHRAKLSEHLELPQADWCNALKEEDPESKFKKAIELMKNYQETTNNKVS
jgi:hypothetical protein